MIIANMQATALKPWMPRIAAFVVALLLGASAVYWALGWPSVQTGPALPPPQASDELPAASGADIGRLLGAAASPVQGAGAPDASSRFALTGVVALGAGRGVALISIDGKPARPYRVGSRLEEGWVLQSVGPRSVALGDEAASPARLQLALPARQP